MRQDSLVVHAYGSVHSTKHAFGEEVNIRQLSYVCGRSLSPQRTAEHSTHLLRRGIPLGRLHHARPNQHPDLLQGGLLLKTHGARLPIPL